MGSAYGERGHSFPLSQCHRPEDMLVDAKLLFVSATVSRGGPVRINGFRLMVP